MLMYGNITPKPKAGTVNRDTPHRSALTGSMVLLCSAFIETLKVKRPTAGADIGAVLNKSLEVH